MKFVLTLATLLVAQLAVAQVEVVEKTYKYTGQELDLEIELGTEINIQSWDKQEIGIKISYEVNGGEDNKAISIDMDDHVERLAIDIEVSDRALRGKDYCCCDGGSRSYGNRNGNYRSCIDIVVEVMLPASADLRIKSVISDVMITGMASNIEVETVTGEIDLAWSQSEGADVTMKTTTGDLYTNVDMDRKRDKGLMQISGHDLKGSVRNGGKEVWLKTVTSDIYFRKPKE